MTIVQLRTLGALQVTLAATTVTAFPTDKIRALLVYLALEQSRAHRRETLAALFWPAIDPSLALNNLRVTLHRLRETLDKAQPGLGSTLITSTRQTLQLNRDLITSDVAAFQRLLNACATHAHAALHQCVACRARLIEVVDLYRGELLAGFALIDAPAFEEWLLISRETLHQQALAALHTLVQGFEAQEDDERAHYYASRQLALDPSREEAHRQLMRSLARRGLRTEALAQFETCRRLLREQLDVAPDLATITLVEQIRAGKLDTRQEIRDTRYETQDTRHEGTREIPEDLPVSLSPVSLSPVSLSPVSLSPVSLSSQDWGEAPEVSKVYGRQHEEAQVAEWLVGARCRVVALLGIGGVGKTTLAAATVNVVAPHFARVLWRSLLNAPPLDELLRDVLQRLADERLITIPTSLDAQLALLLDFLRQRRCLLVLDNLESILNAEQPGHMRPGYSGYAQLLQTVAQRNHQSCLLLTSRERPQGLEHWEEDFPLVRTLALEGIPVTAGRAMLTARGLAGAADDAATLIERYSGNPLALKLVAQTVQDLFHGDIATFLAVEAPIFDDIRTVLDQQFARLSPLEQELLLWLAIEREPVTLQQVRANLVQPGALRSLIEALRGLQRRSLVNQSAHGFLLQNVITEYLTDRLVEQGCEEILDFGSFQDKLWILDSGADESQSKIQNLKSKILSRYALCKATAKEYVRASQVRLIVEPLVARVQAQVGRAGLMARLNDGLAALRAQTAPPRDYTAGNLLNLLLHLDVDVSGYDFSRLTLRQAYLQRQALAQVNFSQAHLIDTVFTHMFGEILAIGFDATEQLLMAGLAEGRLYLWGMRTHNRELTAQDKPGEQQLRAYQALGRGATIAHFSPDGRLLVSGHTDHTVQLWDVATGQRLHTLVKHHETPWALCFAPTGKTLATSGADGVVHVWEVATGQLRQSLQADSAAIPALAFTPDGQTLATGDVNGLICVWRLDAAPPLRPRFILRGHTEEVHALAFERTGTLLASGSHDFTVRLWDITQGTLRHELRGHTQTIRTLAMSNDGRTLASGGFDTFVCLWNIEQGQPLRKLLDLEFASAALAFSPDGQVVAAAGQSQTIGLWQVNSGQRLDLIDVYECAPVAIAFTPDGKSLASGSTDGIVRLWECSASSELSDELSGEWQVTSLLHGHLRWILALAVSPDGRTLASAGYEPAIRLWDRASGRHLHTLEGHTSHVECLHFSPDGQRLVSTGRDQSVRLWDLAVIRPPGVARRYPTIQILQGHTERNRACAFSPDGQWVASAGMDRTVRLWNLAEETPVPYVLEGHTNGIRCLAFSPDGRLLASGSYDQTVRLWDVQRRQLVNTWPVEHTIVFSLAFHPNGELLAMGNGDHCVRLWDVRTGQLVAKLPGHGNNIETITFSPDGRLLASGSYDETIRLWDVAAALAGRADACRQILRAPGLYAGLKITGVTGISGAQKAALKALGAVEE